jgi:hypothetical protein
MYREEVLSKLNMFFDGTMMPWLISGLVLLSLLAVSVTIKAWREAKKSPYFFLRQQAQHRMQRYATLTLALTLTTLGTAAFGWQPPPDTSPRYALITNTKPVISEASASEALLTRPADEIPTIIEIGLAPASQRDAAIIELADPQARPVPILPAEYDNFEPRAALQPTTSLGSIAFSTEVDSRYAAVDASRRFVEGRFTVYATFRYEDMVNGLAWSWVWRHNNEVVSGGNALWKDGPSGPGYIYYSPEGGFLPGEYSLDVWVNGELMTSANLLVAPGISAGN